MASFYFIDSFSREAFQGNPSPVCLLEQDMGPATMAQLAQEWNAPVTAFVKPKPEGKKYSIRYFTLAGEIPACGHATLAAAYALFQQQPSLGSISFQTIEQRELLASWEQDRTYIRYPKFLREDFEVPEEVLQALGLDRYMTTFYSPELESLFIEVPDTSLVWGLKPDFMRLRSSSDVLKEVVVMCRAEEEGYDFILRSFCPWIGIEEDPVTGSIHSVLGPYWQDRLQKNELEVWQASARGGKVFVKVQEEAILLGGFAKILVSGQLHF